MKDPVRFTGALATALLALPLVVTAPAASASVADGAWSRLAPSDPAPVERREHVAVYDAQRDRYLMFAGWNFVSPHPSGLFREVRALDLGDAPAWEAFAIGNDGPGERHSPQWGYDAARQRLIVFGGYGHHYPDDPNAYLNDVWELSLEGEPEWKELHPAGTPPTERLAGASVYDPLRQRFVGFGGTVGQPIDTYSLELSGDPEWKTLLEDTTTSPLAGYGMTAIYDPVRDRMVMFGGSISDAYYGVRNDVWILDLSGAPHWTRIIPAGTPPAPRRTLSSIYDPLRDRMIIFGGWDSQSNDDSSFLNDVWALSLGGDPTWTKLEPVTGQYGAPVGRDASAAIYDPVKDRMVLFGGWSGSSMLNDTWFLTWAKPSIAATAVPNAQVSPTLAHIGWQTVGTTGPLVGVYRRVGSGPWSSVGTSTVDAQQRVFWNDATIVPGQQIAYQLVMPSQRGAVLAGQVQVNVPTVSTPQPGAFAFALDPVKPNPLVGKFAVSFTLPSDAPAKLQVIDVSGRIVATRTLDALGAGPQQIVLGEARDFRPGLYFVRLTHEDRSLVTRAVIAAP